MARTLADLEEELATHPSFGDAAAIRARAAAFGELALPTVEGGRALSALLGSLATPERMAMLLSPVIRDAMAREDERGARVLAYAAEAVRLGGTASFDDGRGGAHALVSETERAYVFHTRADERVLTEHFRHMFAEKLASELGRVALVLRDPLPDELATLNEAAALLRRALPRLFDSALAHVDVVALVDSEDGKRAGLIESASWVRFPATVFLSPLALVSPRQAAESLFHEAVHHKHYDLRRSRSIVASDYREERAVEVVSPWNDDDRVWPSARATSACHVYTHLALLHAAIVERLGDAASKPLAIASAERARYLVDELLTRAEADQGSDGRALTAWLAEQIGALETAIAAWP